MHPFLQFFRRRPSRRAGLFLAVAAILLAATVIYAAPPAFLSESVVGPAGPHTYEYWYSSSCNGGADCECDTAPDKDTNNDGIADSDSGDDCIAHLDTDGDGLFDDAQDNNGNNVWDVVDFSYTSGGDGSGVVESVPWNFLNTISTYAGWGLKYPQWDRDFNREVHIYQIGALGRAFSDGSRVELSADWMTNQAPEPRGTVLHELWHTIQHAYGANSGAGKWSVEGQARMMQDKVFTDLDDKIDSRYVKSVNKYLGNPTYVKTEDRDGDGVSEFSQAQGLLGASYDASLWWTYLAEQAGTQYTGTEAEGVDFLKAVLEQAETWGRTGVDAVDLELLQRIGRGFDDTFWDFTIANYAKEYDLSLLDHATLDGRDPETVLKYRDEQRDSATPAPYNPVASSLYTSSDLLSGVSGTVKNALPTVSDPNGMPAYGAQYYVGLLPAPQDCPLAYWQVSSNGDTSIMHSWLLIQDDSNGDGVDEVIDLDRHEGPDFGRSLLVNSGHDRIAGIVATSDEAAGYFWKMGCTTPVVNIVEPNEGTPAPVGYPSDPGRFLLWVDVSDSSGLTDFTTGLDWRRDFAVTVGGEPATILNGDYVQNLYWLTVQAPAMASASAGDTFDVSVELVNTGAADSESNAVVYDLIPKDQVLVLDRSSSMTVQDKMASAKAAARGYADASQRFDGLGVVSFSDNAVQEFAFSEVPDQDDAAGVRANAMAAIDAIVPNGQTSIGAGLRMAQNMLDANGDPDHPWWIVLLSDGVANRLPTVGEVLGSVVSAGTDVHAIALGSDADVDSMRGIAEATCGALRVDECFHALNEDGVPVARAAAATNLTNELADLYLRIYESVYGHQRLWQAEGTGSQTINLTVDESGGREALFNFNWTQPSAAFNVSISGPAGVSFVQRSDSANHTLFFVEELLPGDYTITLSGQNEWIGRLSARKVEGTELHAFVDTTPDERVNGLPIQLQISLTDGNGPVSGASVSALVYRPDGSQETILLRDDGVAPHDDEPNDGVYGYRYDRINGVEEHTYAFDITASGPGFTRYKRLTYRPVDTSSPDADADGCRDTWEGRFENPKIGVQDCDDDPDRDGLSNREEQALGTNPDNPDSDRGGEMDGSEVDHGRNPLQADDDALSPITDFWIENGQEQVTLHFNPKPEYGRVRVFRRTAKTPYTSLGEFKPTGEIVDGSLVNGENYLYRIQALAGGGSVRGRPSPAGHARPAQDPVAPEGQLIINDDDKYTGSVNVDLAFVDVSPDVTHVKVSNSPDLRRIRWRAYQPQLPWTIQPHPESGVAFVYVVLRDASGNVSEYDIGDGIIYDSTLAPVPGPSVASGQDDSQLASRAWGISDYPPRGSSAGDLRTGATDALALQQILSATCGNATRADCVLPDASLPWTARFTQRNGDALAKQWKRQAEGGMEEAYVDSADLAFFSGQGSRQGLRFGGDDSTLTPLDAYASYGDGDLDWAVFAAGRVLDSSQRQRWAGSMNGLRLLLGFQTPRADTPLGAAFARFLRLGYSFTQAWFMAIDLYQPPGVAAQVLAEEAAYFNDRPAQHDAETQVDDLFCTMTHSTGSPEVRRPSAESVTSLPIFDLRTLSPEEADARFQQLADAFALSTEGSTFDPSTGTRVSADGQLELDPRSGVYHYTATDDLWQWTIPGAGTVLLTPQQAQGFAEEFLQQKGLLPEDVQVQQVLSEQMVCGAKAGLDGTANDQPLSADVTTYVVRFARSLGEATKLSVTGPGAGLRVYVKAHAPVDANGEAVYGGDLIVGVVDGQRALSTDAMGAAAALQPLDPAKIRALARDPQLAAGLALSPIPLDEVTQVEVLDQTLAYWERARGQAQQQLVPIYQLALRVRRSDGNAVRHVLPVPASPAYMPPLARIASVRTSDGADPGGEVRPGTALVLEAVDASTPLNQLGHDASLDFAPGSGHYSYTWYRNQATPENRIGEGRTLTYTPPVPGEETLILEVADLSAPQGSSVSSTGYSIAVRGGSIYLPVVQR